MRASCTNCSAEYEFEEVRIGPRGITVRCTRCHHHFHVDRPRRYPEPPTLRDSYGPPPEWSPAIGGDGGWRIRRIDGTMLEFDGLSTLQSWILANRVSAEDLISRGGKRWLSLGEIVEFQSLFLAVAERPSLPPAGETVPDVVPSRPVHVPTPRITGEVPAAQASPEIDPRTESSIEPPSPRATIAWAGPTIRQVGDLGLDMATQEARERRGARGFAWGLVGVVVVGVAGFLAFNSLQTSKVVAPRSEAPASMADRALVQLLDAADAALAIGHDTALVEADRDYSEVLDEMGTPPEYPALAVRARLGRAQIFTVRAIYARLLGESADVHLARVSAELGEAQRLGPLPDAGELLAAERARLAGDSAAANSILEGLEGRGGPDAALLALALELDATEGERAADVAVKAAALPACRSRQIRAGLLESEAWYRAGRVDRAIARLDALGKAHPRLRLVESLRHRWKATAEAVAPQNSAPPSSPNRPPPRSNVTRAGRPSLPPSGGQINGLGYDALMSRGDRLLMSGRSADARKFFVRAAEVAPTRAEPVANLGWCDLDQGRAAEATRSFERALRIHSGYADARYGLARSHEKAGRNEDAAKTYREYLERHPRGRNAGIVRRKLERLR